ncbi:MAG: ABC transporter substrate-binding protein, partial [Fervidobacterium sp.]
DLKMADIVEHSPFFGKKSDYYVAFSKNFHGSFLSEIFSKQLSEFKKTKEYQSILRKYGIEYRMLWK